MKQTVDTEICLVCLHKIKKKTATLLSISLVKLVGRAKQSICLAFCLKLMSQAEKQKIMNETRFRYEREIKYASMRLR